MKNIGEILKNSREDLDMTQVEVMNITGINNKTLSGYENGVSEPDLETFATLLNLYNLSADEVLDIKKSKDKININLSPAEYKLVTHFRMLSEDQRRDLSVMLKALADKDNI